jgi:hypothetical protein
MSPKPMSDWELEQAWFSQAITQPLDAGPGAWAEQAEARLLGTGAMSSLSRLQVYHRQYWYRLITVMQTDYVCTLHVMGLSQYNEWVMRYLKAHPPNSPYLNDLDKAFLGFLSEHYAGGDRDLVLEAAAYDRAFARAFEGAASGEEAVTSLRGADLMRLRFRLADHASALSLTHDWSAYRLSVFDDDSLTLSLAPPVPMPFHRVVYRHDHTLYEKEMPAMAVAVLAAMHEPGSLAELFDRLGELSEGDAAELEGHLTAWFADFIERGWVVAESGV